MIPGEAHRDTVLSGADEEAYFDATLTIGNSNLTAYQRALTGIQAVQRGKAPIKPADPFLLRDVATILLDCGLRPEECFRLRWEHVRDGAVHVPFGKTDNARRTIPLTQTGDGPDRNAPCSRAFRRVGVSRAIPKAATLKNPRLKKQHPNACKLAKVAPFPLYTFRHTCLTRWAASWTRTRWPTWPATAISRRRGAMSTHRFKPSEMPWNARGWDRSGHSSGHNSAKPQSEARNRLIAVS